MANKYMAMPWPQKHISAELLGVLPVVSECPDTA